MQPKTSLAIGLVVGIFIGMFAAPVVRDHSMRGRCHSSRRPSVFVGKVGFGHELDNGVGLPQAKELWEACPNTPLVTWNHKEADYTVSAYWDTSKNTWRVSTSRTDSAWLSFEESPDFARLMRHVCSIIQEDSSMGIPLKSDASQVGRASESDRFDIHEIRNGPVMTSALFDRRTGKVWIWSKGKNGNTSFFQEDVIPEPEK
jgi:hypothetical protein